MGTGDRVPQRGSYTEQHIAEIDEKVVSPGERANYIWKLLKQEHPDLTDWDVLCFASEYLAMMSSAHLWLEDAAKKVVGLIYTAHYMNPEAIDVSSILKRTPRAPDAEPQHSEAKRDASPKPQSDGDRIIRTRFSFGG